MEDRGKASLERRYRQWLRLYPREYRGEREEEILQTLLELSRPGQRWPAPREVAAVALQGLRVRAKAAEAVAAQRLWLAALPLAACLLLVVRLGQVILMLPAAFADPTTRTAGNVALLAWSALMALLALTAVHRRRYRLAIVLAAVPAPVDGGVVDLQPAGQGVRLLRWEGLVEGGGRVGVEVVHDQSMSRTTLSASG